MALQQAVGATIGWSASLPATHDAAGMGALAPTAVGKVNSVPDLDGTRDIATFDNLSTGEEEKFADVWRAGNGTFQVGLDESDAGQSALATAASTGEKGVLVVTLKSGAKYYRPAIITSYKPTNISTGNVVMAEVGVEFERTTVKVAA